MVLNKKIYVILLSVCLILAMIGLYGIWYEVKPKMEAQEFYYNMNSEMEQVFTKEESISQPNMVLNQKSKGLTEMMKAYPNMVGWIRCEGISIDYPIMQTDDNSYYLDHLPDGSKNRLGSIFLDKSVKSDFSSPVSIIYGHMMQSNEMFGELNNYRKQDFYEKHSKLELYTMEGKKSLVLLAAYLVDGSSNPYPKEFGTSDAFYAYIQEIQSKSFFESKEKAVPSDKLVILSTCAYDFDEARLAIVGYLVP